MNKIWPVLALALLLPFVSAVCWGENDMPPGSVYYQAWLCISNGNHGWIYSIGPNGYPSAGRTFKVELSAYTGLSPYAATLTCYEQYTDVEPPSRMGGKSGVGILNSVPPGPSYSWHYQAQVTLNSGESTYPGIGNWISAGCPPVANNAHQAGSPPQVQIGINWNGFGGNRATSVAVPIYASFGVPLTSYLDSAVSVNDGATSSAYKFVKRKAFKR